MQIDGGCHCGQITFRAEIDPAQVYVCHCSDCQSISGSPLRWAVPVPEQDFTLLKGEPKAYVKAGDSGRDNHQHFCPNCASPIYSVSPGAEPVIFRLRLGTVRQREQLTPKGQYWRRSAQGWACDLPDTWCVERQ